MRILNLRLNNFKSFEDQYIDFEHDIPDGFVHIKGRIGSGKTSIGEAILFALYGTVRNKTNKQLLSWGKNRGFVEIEFINGAGNHIHIFREMKRYQTSQLLITIDGGVPGKEKKLDGANKLDVQKTLETEYYDIPGYIMDMMCIISFNNFKSLSTLNTKDSRQLLDFLLGLEQLNPGIEKLKVKMGSNREKLIELNTEIRLRDARLSQDEEKIKQLEQENDNLYLELMDKVYINERYKELKDVLIPDIKENQMEPLKEKQGEYDALIKNYSKSLTLLKKQKQCTCPTCLRDFSENSQGNSQENSKENILDNIKNKINELSDKGSVITKQLITLNEQLYDYQRELKADYLNIEEEIKKKIKENEVIIKQLQNNIAKNSISGNIPEKSDENDLSMEDLTLEQQITIVEKEQILLDELIKELIGPVRNKVISKFVPILNRHIESYSAQLSLPYQPYFTGNEFECKIKNLEHDDIDISSLSTGQTKSVDMIVILSIITTILYHNNMNIIFLDELFTNLDPEIKYKLINILKSNLPGKKILAISHENFPDSILDGSIELKYSYPVSKIERI